MAPARTMTGETLVTEKRQPQTPSSPARSDASDQTMTSGRGDAIIEIEEEQDDPRLRPSSESHSISPVGRVDNNDAQPRRCYPGFPWRRNLPRVLDLGIRGC
jgi:hypothetical protein